MGDQAMPLRDEDIKRIGEYVKPWIRELVGAAVPQPALVGIDSQLLERMVRVEEELKLQRRLMDERFAAMDRRFEDLIGYMDKRFEAVDRRFEDLIGHTDKRFEAVDNRFNDMQASIRSTQWLIGAGFVLITAAIAVFQFLS